MSVWSELITKKNRSSFIESSGNKPHTATNCRNSSLLRAKPNNNGISTGVYRGNTLTWGCWGCYPQLCQTRQGDTACAFLGSPTALEISESNLATFLRKLRRAPMRVWSVLITNHCSLAINVIIFRVN